VGQELAAVIEREMPDRTPVQLTGVAEKARQEILKMKLYLILKKKKLVGETGEPPVETP
jgi:hypothetical protein